MAAATTTRSSYFTWPDEFRAEIYPNFGIVRDLSPRKSRAAWTSNYSRSISVGSVSSPERQAKPEPERRRSKSVHFADSKGLALVSVLTFNAERELEDTFSRLVKGDHWRTTTKAGKCRPACEEALVPAILPTKLEKKVRCQKICLEKTELLDCAIRGTVFVENLAYEKCVTARYTLDGWKSQEEVQGVFHSNSNIKDIDTFVFEIPVQKDSPPKNYKMEFAICYTVLGDTFWDNNNGFNYHFLFASSRNPALL